MRRPGGRRPADHLDGPGVVRLMERVRGAVFLGEALRYRPRSELHRRRIRRVRDQVRALDANDLWAGVRYQPITLGESVGRLRFIEGPAYPSEVLPDPILVLAHVPNDIPLSAGIVTAEVQAPPAHIAVLSQSRGTPNMALRGVFENAALRALDEHIVRLAVGATGCAITPSDAHGGRPLLEERAMGPLRDRLDRVHAHLMARWGERADAADIELALRRDGTAVILQARPYRMRRE